MPIESIDAKLCNGCGLCEDTCSADVIRMDPKTHKAQIKYQDDCHLCALCEWSCPKHAIHVSPVRRPTPLTSW